MNQEADARVMHIKLNKSLIFEDADDRARVTTDNGKSRIKVYTLGR